MQAIAVKWKVHAAPENKKARRVGRAFVGEGFSLMFSRGLSANIREGCFAKLFRAVPSATRLESAALYCLYNNLSVDCFTGA